MICRDAGSVTAILCELKLGEAVTTFRTSGFGVDTVEWKNFSFAVWSVGDQDKAPSLWRHFCQGSKLLTATIETRSWMQKKSSTKIIEDEMRDAVVLAFANTHTLDGNSLGQEID